MTLLWQQNHRVVAVCWCCARHAWTDCLPVCSGSNEVAALLQLVIENSSWGHLHAHWMAPSTPNAQQTICKMQTVKDSLVLPCNTSADGGILSFFVGTLDMASVSLMRQTSKFSSAMGMTGSIFASLQERNFVTPTDQLPTFRTFNLQSTKLS